VLNDGGRENGDGGGGKAEHAGKNRKWGGAQD
jgi:hypothetical protein